MKLRLLILPLLAFVACAEPEPESTEVVQDAGCSESPGASCSALSCYTCENQHKPECIGICQSHECWDCVDGRWQMTAVDCMPCWLLDAGTPAP